MSDVKITGMNRITKPKANLGGSIVLAWFDCEANGFAFKGCALVRTKRNGLVAWLPKIEGEQSRRRCVDFIDSSIRHAMMLNARETYRLLGGTDAEEIGKSVPMGPREAAAIRAEITA